MKDKPASIPKTATDPVCGHDISLSTSHFSVQSGDMTHYFCSHACRQEFLKRQETNGKAVKKRLWARYLSRLNKATDGRTPPCCS
jgi:YHS domain-containing protein